MTAGHLLQAERSPTDKIAMCEFLAQFKLLDNFSCEHRHLDNIEQLGEAIALSLVKNWVPKSGATSCTYHATAVCTPKGRLYLKRELNHD